MARGKKRAETSPSKRSSSPKKPKQSTFEDGEPCFTGPPVPSGEAESRWPNRYQSQNTTEKVLVTLPDGSTEEKMFMQARCHYTKAIVDDVVFNLFDDAYIQAPEGEPFVAKIVEMFETVSKETYICTQWFYRAKDTVIKDQDNLIDPRRVFYSFIRDENPLNSILSKVKIIQLTPNMDDDAKKKAKDDCELYVDMMYTFPFAFSNFCTDSEDPSVSDGLAWSKFNDAAKPQQDTDKSKTSTLLDLYSGCGAMSSGLSIGASLGGETIVKKWAVDFNADACESLKFNHPNTEVRNEDAEDFLVLLKEWDKLCKDFNLVGSKEVESDKSEIEDGLTVPSGELEVEKLVGICYRSPNGVKSGTHGIHYKVHWKGYSRAEDTWEPAKNLGNCKEKIKDFVSLGQRAKILPRPGDVDFLCGGPPCQGISGHNRYRLTSLSNDKKNNQLVVFMDVVEFLKPRYVLMENVTDILKFAEGQLTNYAVGRLIAMNYQARLGIMAAGAYGVPQCRMRFFLWGAGPMERLPQFPLPTHEVMKKGVVINEFKEIITGHGNEHIKLHKSVLLGEAISDLPEVTNDADLDEMAYGRPPRSEFQKYIRMKRNDIFPDSKKSGSHKSILYDHRPLKLNPDDFERVGHIPKVKGANFRNMPGVIVGKGNVVELDPSRERLLCKSKKPLVPDYALTFEGGKSTKPFGRLWKDEIVATVVTRAKPHNQVILHPKQDRVLSAREIARLQGFPDCYKLYGPVKERYKQVGNAVSFSVSIPLGYCLAKAMQGSNNAIPLRLPFKFPDCLQLLKAGAEDESEELL